MWFIRFRSNQRDMIRLAVLSAIVLAGGIASAAGAAADDAEPAKAGETAEVQKKTTMEAGETAGAMGAAEAGEKPEADTYPLETCIVSGSKLGSMGEPVVYEYEGREIRFCCKGCIKQFDKDPEAYLDKMDEAIVARDLADYPLAVCVVSGQELGSMGDPVDYVYDNHLVRFCCKGCIKAFENDPDKYIARIDGARKAQAAAESPEPYPFDTCLVSGGKLGSMGDAVTYVHDGREVQFCCGGCLSQFKKNPEKYMEKLHAVGSDPADETSEH